MSKSVVEANEKNFTTDLQKGVVLVDFYADWCGPCRMMAPILDTIAKDMAGQAVIAKLDIEKEQNLAAQFQVTSIPTLVLFKDGKEIDRIVGLTDAENIKKLITNALHS